MDIVFVCKLIGDNFLAESFFRFLGCLLESFIVDGKCDYAVILMNAESQMWLRLLI
jgi:hypothetical protein